ncbi:ATP-dependent RecD-like DNA helicase [Clostridium sardiniense]
MKCEIQVDKILFPKRALVSGDFAIFTGKIKKVLDGEEPIVNPKFLTVTLKGNVPQMSEGDVLIITFGSREDNQYGTTYNIKAVSKGEVKLDGEGLKDFLELIAGKKIAKEMVDIENIFELLENQNDSELLKINGVGKKKLELIYRKFQKNFDEAYALSKLVPLGITPNKVSMLCKALTGGSTVVETCFNNPYSLVTKVKGLGFKGADDIAIKCGVTDEATRIKYAILYVLSTQGEMGRSWLTAIQIMEELSKLFIVTFDTVAPVIHNMVQEKDIYINHDGTKICLKKYFHLELDIANRVRELLKEKSFIDVPSDWKEKVKEIELKQGWSFTTEQLQGIESTLKNNVVLITGYAGTGKSTVTNAMCEILDSYNIVMACLSAKASQRLREVTGRNAQTLHSLLGINSENEVDELDADVIIIDETTMVNGDIMKKVFFAIRSGAKVIMLGDVGQLTSIGNCAVFNDLIESGKIPHVNLTEIHRQAKKSNIVIDSINIRNQKPIYPKGFKGRLIKGELQDLELFVGEKENLLNEAVNGFFNEFEKENDIREVQIITPLKTRGDISVYNINKTIQSRLYPIKPNNKFIGKDYCEIFIGDKVINTKNKRSVKSIEGKSKLLANGNIGIVKAIMENGAIIDFAGLGQMLVEKKDYRDINLAYAISVHSSQGSQWNNVIIVCDTGAYTLLNVEILYTAITRAKIKARLVIEPMAMGKCLRTVEQKTKQTFLKEFL